jgi:hypothetical protein
MLSTFLAQLQSYFSKYFVIGSFCPMLAFVFLNGLVAYPLVEAWRGWADANILQASAGGAAFFTASIVVGIVLAAYVLAALSDFLRRHLEGQWSPWLRKLFSAAQHRRREVLLSDLNLEGTESADLSYADAWFTKIDAAAREGQQAHPNIQYRPSASDTIARDLAALEEKRNRYQLTPANKLETLASRIAGELKVHDIDKSNALNEYVRRLHELTNYAIPRARARRARFQNEINSNFGEQDIAPTKMGNVANTIQGYVLRRYHCNFESVWSNLQRIIPKDDKANAALQEAKTQLDFLIACCWLTLLSALFWSFAFAIVDPNRAGFLLAALGGPAIAYMWYRAAAEQYRSFADVAMTSFDTFRFDLFTNMRLKQPVDVEDERGNWEYLDKLTTFGESQNFRYDPPSK